MVEKKIAHPRNSRRHSSRQHTDIVHKSLHQLLVLVRRIARHGQVTLPADFSSRYFDLELVLKVAFRWGLY